MQTFASQIEDHQKRLQTHSSSDTDNKNIDALQNSLIEACDEISALCDQFMSSISDPSELKELSKNIADTYKNKMVDLAISLDKNKTDPTTYDKVMKNLDEVGTLLALGIGTRVILHCKIKKNLGVSVVNLCFQISDIFILGFLKSF